MPRTLELIARTLLILAVFTTLPAAASEPPAESAESANRGWFDLTQGPRFEFFLSSIFANSTTEGSFGVRGAVPFNRLFHLEGSLSRFNDDRVDLWLADISAKYYLRDRQRTDIYLVAGTGLFYSSDLDAEEPMLHLGIGTEIALGRHFYLRPELRGRWFAEELDATTLADLSVGFGWRF